MISYEIITGRVYSDSGELWGVGYSGFGPYKNIATAQSLRDEGPIPEGIYTIGAPEDTVTHGPYVLPLTPDPNNLMWGRAGFLIHGDSVISPGTASRGCIILARDVREQIWASGDHSLQVLAQLDYTDAT